MAACSCTTLGWSWRFPSVFCSPSFVWIETPSHQMPNANCVLLHLGRRVVLGCSKEIERMEEEERERKAKRQERIDSVLKVTWFPQAFHPKRLSLQ